ncbi:MAG: DUF1636 domain-containing protein [Timaviella obliquedivisa GSE-PSE-MK23-08B]|nr:DUF1636 domain-containing protein [Timaviella obliquedivisa GSE-PSE-MK23-08B]
MSSNQTQRVYAIAFSAADKVTYLFTNVPANEADALLQFDQLYRQSEDGYVLPAKMPESLRSRLLVRVPPVS